MCCVVFCLYIIFYHKSLIVNAVTLLPNISLIAKFRFYNSLEKYYIVPLDSLFLILYTLHFDSFIILIIF